MNLRSACPARQPCAAQQTPVVFIVDADASVREGMQFPLRAAGWQVETSTSAEAFLARPRIPGPSCLLTELHLPGLSGLELQRQVAEETDLPVIFMSRYANVPATVQAMKAGAFEFLTKPFVPEALISAIGDAIQQSHRTIQDHARARALQARYESLSRREREVMELVASGRMNKQVGGELGISEITVKAHRGQIMRKMQASCLADLVRMQGRLHELPTLQRRAC